MVMKAGTYYIGDLCYVFNMDDWNDVCNITMDGREGEFELPDGRMFALYNTAYGDGEYNDQFGNKYSVDSGTIGCVLWKDTSRYEYILADVGAVVDMKEDFDTCSDGNGLIKIGSTTIDTAEEWLDQYDEENEEWS
jgi:hypothetical protein